MHELEPFAQLLKEHRHALDVTQRELADRVGCTLSTIAKLENAERRPSKQLLDLLAATLQLTLPEAARLVALARARPPATPAQRPFAAPSGIPSGAPIVTSGRPVLVGREQEWARLQELWQYAASGAPHLCVISGVAGIGKTRLVDELLAMVRRQQCVAALAQAFSVDATLAYRPIIKWLESDDIRDTLPHLDRIWLMEIARLLPEVLEEQTSRSASGPLMEPWQRGHLFEALSRAVLGDRSPRLLVLDDLHWCDHETLDWLSYLLRFDARAPVFVVATLRSEEIDADHPARSRLLELARSGITSRIALDPLDEPATALLASQVVGHTLDAEASSRIYAESEGNPLFIVEIARSQSLETPSRARGMAPAFASDLPHPTIPPAVYAVMLARLGHLPAETHGLVELAAAYGEAVSYRLLREITGETGAALAHQLDALCRQGILREAGEDTYDFTHHKLREVANTRMSSARRHALHERIARALEVMHAGDLDRASAQIAAHYERACLPERALPYYQQAAQAAREMYANAEAMAHLRRALSLVSAARQITSAQRHEYTWRLNASLADLLELGGQHTEALMAYQQAVIHLPPAETLVASQLQRRCAKVWEVQRRYAEAADAYAAAETVLGAAPAETETAWWHAWLEVQLDRMWLYFWQGKWADILRVAEHARSIVARLGTSLQRARYFHGLALAAYRRDRFVGSAESLAYCQAHLAASQETAEPRQMGFAHFVLGYDLMLQAAFDDAERELRAGLQIADRTGDIVLQARCLVYLARLSRHHGDVQSARSYANRCLSVAEAGGMLEYVAMGYGVLSWIAWREGDTSAVRRHAQAAVQLWRDLPIVYSFQWAALLPLMGVSTKTKEYAAAIDYARAMLDPAQQRLPERLAVELQAAVHAWDTIRVDEAVVHLTHALAIAEETCYI